MGPQAGLVPQLPSRVRKTPRSAPPRTPPTMNPALTRHSTNRQALDPPVPPDRREQRDLAPSHLRLRGHQRRHSPLMTLTGPELPGTNLTIKPLEPAPIHRRVQNSLFKPPHRWQAKSPRPPTLSVHSRCPRSLPARPSPTALLRPSSVLISHQHTGRRRVAASPVCPMTDTALLGRIRTVMVLHEVEVYGHDR
jgi:hypothetical protein